MRLFALPRKTGKSGFRVAFPGRLIVVALAATLTAQADPKPPAPTGPPPGIVVAASPEPEKIYLFSPSLEILDDGELLVSYDSRGTTYIRASGDKGLSWEPRGSFKGQKWSTLFSHRKALYAIGVTTPGGAIAIRRSTDRGKSWTEPVDGESGLLAEGDYHCGPVPIIVHGGRIWRAFEEFSAERPRRRFSAFVMSASEDADLLRSGSWKTTNRLTVDRRWLNTRNEEWLEGNVVVTPDGELVNVLRFESHQAEGAGFDLPLANKDIRRFEVAAMMRIDSNKHRLTFDPDTGFLPFIGGESKFTIRKDPEGGRYWTLANKVTRHDSGSSWERSPHHQRNVVSLVSSPDLRTWEEHYRPLSFAPRTVVTKAGPKVGFQYLDWHFDGADIIAVCRTSWGGANYHDSNFITFHRIPNFRTVTMSNSPADLSRPVATETESP
ncbi:hypothetical protein HAHE_36060 [Haloferula helveola]|uniref:Exo-alpha-sialidase n=1 Tax=Haloferula helveola TaxID=490095 RepID=A0ABN6H898_9BACT|nr:hypothetical protein HAHE_36060 [Haloferula helveola]